MGPLIILVQLVAALGLLNVWLLRVNRSTPYRGGAARNMREEFAAYGLPAWMVAVVGVLKVGVALALIIGIWYRQLALSAALLLCVLMLGALAMHFRIHDPLRKSAPAAVMLTLAILVVLGSLYR
ncbi:MAG: DoxX family protein [Gemmatimonadota bacterium]|nr:DoxX family protein [Gemmatimonadota bacterium]